MWVICHPVARLDIAYLCTKSDDFMFSRSSDMIGAPKFRKESHDLTTPLSGMSSVGCDLHIQPVHRIWSVCNHQLGLRSCIRQRKM